MAKVTTRKTNWKALVDKASPPPRPKEPAYEFGTDREFKDSGPNSGVYGPDIPEPGA